MKLNWIQAVTFLSIIPISAAGCTNASTLSNNSVEARNMTDAKLDKCDRSDCDASERMIVGWASPPHSGFTLMPPDDTNTYYVVLFEDNEIQMKFEDFFRASNLEKALGKRIFCNCYGRRGTGDGQSNYLVKKASFSIE
jgi:hypothetical protein